MLRGEELTGRFRVQTRHHMGRQGLEQPVDLSGHVFSRPRGEHHGDRLGLQSACGEHDRLKRGRVEPVRVIHGDEQRAFVGGRGQQRGFTGSEESRADLAS